MKRVDHKKLEAALVLALTEFWPGRRPRFSIDIEPTASDGARSIAVILHGRQEPITILRFEEQGLDKRTAALVRRMAQKMAGAWADWTCQQLGEHDVRAALSSLDYEKQVARMFPAIVNDQNDIFEV